MLQPDTGAFARVPMDVIQLTNVSKSYKLYDRPGDRLKELFCFHRRRYHRDHWAVRDLTLGIRKGETFCIVGENGSGKSTLLKLIVGILQPTAGVVRAEGRMTALLELGSGFNPEFTGRANVFLNGSILGLSTEEVEAKLGAILEFAEIGSYIDQPVQTYSSGMVMRLAFAVAVHLDPEILIVDEALAVGDIYFRQRCMRKIHQLRNEGVTIVYVTHETSDVKALGDRALWLHQGRPVEIGPAPDVAAKYLAALVKKDARHIRGRQPASGVVSAEATRPDEVITWLPEAPQRHGDGRGEVLGVQVCDERGIPLEAVQTPSVIVVRISVRAIEAVEFPIVGWFLRTEQGVDLTGTNTSREDIQLPAMRPGDIYTVDFRVRLPELSTPYFTITPAISDGTLLEFRLCDMVENALTVRVLVGEAPVYGYLHFPSVAVKAVSLTGGPVNQPGP